MINVTDGVITAYEPKGQEAAPANPAETTQKPDEQMANDNTQGQPPVANPKAVIESIVKETRFEIEKDYNEKFAKVNELIEAFKKENETLKAENTSLSEKLTKQETFTKEMFSLVEKMAAQPAEAPVAPKKDGVQSKEIVGGLSIWKHK